MRSMDPGTTDYLALEGHAPRGGTVGSDSPTGLNPRWTSMLHEGLDELRSGHDDDLPKPAPQACVTKTCCHKR